MVQYLNIGDVISLKKPHPCGGSKWEIYRVGADIGVKWLNCGKKMFMTRSVLVKMMKIDSTLKYDTDS